MATRRAASIQNPLSAAHARLETFVRSEGLEAKSPQGQLEMLAWDLGYQGLPIDMDLIALGKHYGIDVQAEWLSGAHEGPIQTLPTDVVGDYVVFDTGTSRDIRTVVFVRPADGAFEVVEQSDLGPGRLPVVLAVELTPTAALHTAQVHLAQMGGVSEAAATVSGATPGAGKGGTYGDVVEKRSYMRIRPGWHEAIERAAAALDAAGLTRPGKAIGSGHYAGVFESTTPGWVVKVTGDPSDAAAWGLVLAHGVREPGLAAVRSVFAFPHEFAPEPYRLYGIVMERLAPIDRDAAHVLYTLFDPDSFQLHGRTLPVYWHETIERIRNGEPRGRILRAVPPNPALADKVEPLVRAVLTLQTLGITVHDLMRHDNTMQDAAGRWKFVDLGVSETPPVQIPVLGSPDLERLVPSGVLWAARNVIGQVPNHRFTKVTNALRRGYETAEDVTIAVAPLLDPRLLPLVPAARRMVDTRRGVMDSLIGPLPTPPAPPLEVIGSVKLQCPPADGVVRTSGFDGERFIESVARTGVPRVSPNWGPIAAAAAEVLAAHKVRIGRQLGCGQYACAYASDDPERIVKITGDPADASAWGKVLAAVGRKRWPAGLCKVSCVEAIPLKPPVELVKLHTVDSDHPKKAPPVRSSPNRRMFVMIQERVRPLTRREKVWFDEEDVRKAILAAAADPSNADAEWAVDDLLTRAVRRDAVFALIDTIHWLGEIGVVWHDLHGGNVMATGLGVDRQYKIVDLGYSTGGSVKVPVMAWAEED